MILDKINIARFYKRMKGTHLH